MEKLPVLSESCGFIFDHLLMAFQLMFIYTAEESSAKGAPPQILLLLQQFLQSCIDNLDGEKQMSFCEKVGFCSIFEEGVGKNF